MAKSTASIEGVEEVHEPGRQAGVGVDAAVVLDPYVYVGKVEDAHGVRQTLRALAGPVFWGHDDLVD